MARKKTAVRRTKRPRRSKAGQRPVLPEKQWAMPAGFCADGSAQATLRDVVDPNVATIQLAELSLEQRADLVAQRLELQPQVDLAMIGAGVIDKSRAITEVKNRTKVGKLLIEIEHQMIRNLIEKSQKAAAGGVAPVTPSRQAKKTPARRSRQSTRKR